MGVKSHNISANNWLELELLCVVSCVCDGIDEQVCEKVNLCPESMSQSTCWRVSDLLMQGSLTNREKHGQTAKKGTRSGG